MLEIVTMGDERLKRHSALVPDFDNGIKYLIKEMFDTMYAGKGIGLAAVQVGKLYRIFITHISGDKQRVFINPDIIETSVEQDKIEEGCLSVPGINADVVRPEKVTIQAWSDKGKPFSLDVGGLLGRVIQHELDHLNGILFVDRLSQKKKERLIKLRERQNGE